MANLTTADAIKAADDAWPSYFPANVGGWDLVSQQTKAPRSIVRVLHHKAQPVKATIITHYGRIGEVTVERR